MDYFIAFLATLPLLLPLALAIAPERKKSPLIHSQ